jgi:uncharacterized protein YdaU (DUF1376 family)
MPFFIGDYLGDTAHLTTEQHGAYLLLMLAAWKRGGTIPNEATQLAAITRLPLARWKAHAPLLLAFFEAEGDLLAQGRLVKEYGIAVAANDAQKANGSKGGRPKKQKPNETHGFDSGSVRLNPNESPSPSPVKQEQKQDQKTAPDGDLLTGISPEVAKDFKALRAKLRAPITATAMKGISREAAIAGLSLEAALVMCCERGWRGFKADWVGNARAGPTPTQPLGKTAQAINQLQAMKHELAKDRTADRIPETPLLGFGPDPR